MASGVFPNIFRFLIFFINFGFLALGGILFAYGVKLHLDQNVDILMPSDHSAITAMAFGGFTFFIAFLGCCGAVKEDSCMLRSYAVVVMILLILQITFFVIIFWSTDSDKFQESIKDKIRTSVAGNDTTSVKFMDQIQTSQFCCGFDGPADYPAANKTIPATCCPKDKLTDKGCTNEHAFKKGCFNALKDFYGDNFPILKWVGISALVFQAGAVFVSFVLASNIRRAYDVV